MPAGRGKTGHSVFVKKLPMAAAKRKAKRAHGLMGGREQALRTITRIVAEEHPKWTAEQKRNEIRRQYREIFRYYNKNEFGKDS